jgi:hypothetical protein
MTSIKKTKRWVIATTAGALAVTGIAFAYFSASGSGTGTAAVGTSSALTIHAAVAGTLYPGASSAVTFTVDNPSSGHQQLGTIHLASIKSCVGAGSSWNGSSCSNGGTEATTCESVETGSSDTNAANFWMADTVENQDLASGNGQTVTTNGTLKMNDLSTNQDACKSANLTLNFTS